MELPAGFAFRREGSGLFATCGTLSFGVAPMRRETWRSALEYLAKCSGTELKEVAFGRASGYTVSNAGRVTSYLLRLDGKHVAISLSCDPVLVEPLLHTLAFRDGEI